MLFLCYLEVNDNKSPQEMEPYMQKALQAGILEPEGIKIIRFDGTPDNWGVITMEADSAMAVERFITTLRAAFPGYFKNFKTSSALSVDEATQLEAEILKTVRSW